MGIILLGLNERSLYQWKHCNCGLVSIGVNPPPENNIARLVFLDPQSRYPLCGRYHVDGRVQSLADQGPSMAVLCRNRSLVFPPCWLYVSNVVRIWSVTYLFWVSVLRRCLVFCASYLNIWGVFFLRYVLLWQFFSLNTFVPWSNNSHLIPVLFLRFIFPPSCLFYFS